MTWRTILVVSLGCVGAACAAKQPKRLEDGSYLIKCDHSMQRCLADAAEACDEAGYLILEGSSREEAYGGYNYQTGVERHELVIRCRGLEPPAESAPPSRSAKPPTIAASGAPVCTPGATQRCVGPGACAGGQACLADGSAFGPCDCGPGSGVAESATDASVGTRDGSDSPPAADADVDAGSAP